MAKKHEDNILLESLVSTTSLDSFITGYILKCKIEGKSPRTISGYQMVLNNFAWYCHQNNYPEIQRYTSFHISNFLFYLSSEPKRWDSTSPAVKKPASKNTINGYYRAIRTFFNWLQHEQLITENPFTHLKPPKTENKVIQALTTNEIEHLFKVWAGKSTLDIRNKAIISIFLDRGYAYRS